MTRHFSTLPSLVLFLAWSIRREAIWTNDDFERLSDHRPISIVGQITEEATEVASALTPRIAPAIRVISVFQCHFLNPKEKEMMEKGLFQ
jgi:hypothetical protein